MTLQHSRPTDAPNVGLDPSGAAPLGFDGDTADASDSWRFSQSDVEDAEPAFEARNTADVDAAGERWMASPDSGEDLPAASAIDGLVFTAREAPVVETSYSAAVETGVGEATVPGFGATQGAAEPPTFGPICGCCAPPRRFSAEETGGGADLANGPGKTALIKQVFDAVDNRYEFTGNQDIDAVLIGSRWTPTTLTYSFPTSGTFYADQGYFTNTEPFYQIAFNAQQQAAARYAFKLVESYTNVKFVEVRETATTHANFRFSQTGYSEVSSAYANFPSSSPQAGDIWFGTTGQDFYAQPAKGNWGMSTMLHELGHSLGLKHGHQDYRSSDLATEGYLDHPAPGQPRFGSGDLGAKDGQDWSLMTYSPVPGNTTYQGDGFNQPQTYMQGDIAALQHLYGADFTTNAGATVYKWSAATGEMTINGVAQGGATSNKVSMTLWDGGGVDTYDLSNYAGGVSVNLAPGGFTILSAKQLVDHLPLSTSTALAVGNVANALLYRGDLRSLIENATGGAGADKLRGNQGANVLKAGGGEDVLLGDAGNDTLLGGAANDFLYGDGRASQVGDGLIVEPAGKNNGTLAGAILLNGDMNLANNPNIAGSTTTPHVTVRGKGNGSTFDYYKVNLLAGATVTIDIDKTSAGLDTWVFLLDRTAAVLDHADDSDTDDGGFGSTDDVAELGVGRTQDSFFSWTAEAAGTYYIEVGQFLDDTQSGPLAAGATYDLQVSAEIALDFGEGSGRGNDRLDGGTGADRMAGGLGNDTYVVDNAADVVTEAANAGTDTVQSTLSYSVAGKNVENVTLLGTGNVNATGGTGANTLIGNAGSNRLSGGGGADVMRGGAGNDLYVTDGGDVLTELANQGTDQVTSTASHTLGANFETLQLSGTAALNGTGNEARNTLVGNYGANRLDGKGGADVLRGGTGNDTYVYGAGDTIVEVAGGGTDTVLSSSSHTLKSNVERLVLTGTGAVNGIGNAGANALTGNAGANKLYGKEGSDAVRGGAGADTFVFDTALGAANIDTLDDFSATQDVIWLDNAVFAGLAGGVLAVGAFVFGTAAKQADDRVIYDNGTGALSWDRDGSGTTKALQFASLDAGLATKGLGASDFFVV